MLPNELSQVVVFKAARVWGHREMTAPEVRRCIMTDTHSDALVFFGVTGDLAYKQIFPALYAMIKRGQLNVPIIGVAGRPWKIEQLQAHVHASLQEHGSVDEATFDKLRSQLQYVSG